MDRLMEGLLLSDFGNIPVKEIAAVLPCYHNEGGNATEMVFINDQPAVIHRTVKTVIKNLARTCTVDLKAAREKYGEMLGCKRAVPLVLAPEMIFMVVKVRETISRNDASRGYINYFAVTDATKTEEGTCSKVVLKNGREVTCYHSIRNLNNHIRNCHYIHQMILKETGGADNFSLDYLAHPATKGDIALVLKELRELKEKL